MSARSNCCWADWLAIGAMALAVACTPAVVAARSHGRASHASVARDHRGRIARSSKARRDFERRQPCPATGRNRGRCPGYVIDHVVPLKRGGADDPGNMQWQTTAAAKAKDKTE